MVTVSRETDWFVLQDVMTTRNGMQVGKPSAQLRFEPGHPFDDLTQVVMEDYRPDDSINQTVVAVFDRDQMRSLFNWLGVQLHKY